MLTIILKTIVSLCVQCNQPVTRKGDLMQYHNSFSVLQALLQKKALKDSGKPHEQIKIALIALEGVVVGVFGGNDVTSLCELGFGEVFEVVFGLSTGVPTVAYFLVGQPRVGKSIY